jgi:hypothetical protein
MTKRPPALVPSRPNYRPPPKDDRPPWEVPTPTSIRAAQARRRTGRPEDATALDADAPATRPGPPPDRGKWIRPSRSVRTEPTKAERKQAQELHDGPGLVRPASARNHPQVKEWDQAVRDDQAGLPCACDDYGPCLLHGALDGRRRHHRPSTAR